MRMTSVLTGTLFLTASCLPALCQQNYLQQGYTYAQQYQSRTNDNGVTANGRCGGISYGTGQRSCGTATGGPVGGNSTRNE